MRNIPIPSATSVSCGAATGYTNTFTVTIPAQSGQAGNLTNWPITIQGATIFKTVANGGLSQSNGLDIVFCNAGTILPYYFVSSTYGASNGNAQLIVLAPSILKSSSATFTGVIGKASAADFSCGPSGTNNCSSTLFNNFLFAYTFGGNSAFDLVDISGNCGTATNHGLASGTGEVFDGVNGPNGNSTLFIDAVCTLPALTNFSLMGWGNSNIGADQGMAGNPNAGATAGIFMRMDSFSGGGACDSGGVCMGVGYANTTFYEKVTTTTIKNLGYHHIGGSHTAGSNNMTLYLDGAVVTGQVRSTGSPVDPTTSASHLELGHLGDCCNFLQGNTDELWGLKIAITADQDLFTFNNQSNPTSTYSIATP
jgi:hypothetical protein